jgi:hypothetical protein
MTFELKADGIRFHCSSPELTQKLIERGARLVDPAQAEELLRAVASELRGGAPTASESSQPR